MLAPDKKRFLLERACEAGHLNLDELIAWCRAGNAQFFDTPHGCCISCVIESGGVRILHVIVAGATDVGLKELREPMLKYARDNGCRYVQTKGRLGFEKGRGKRYGDAMEGFKPIGVLYEYDLQEHPP
jgi:hypothetical protein